MSDIGFKSTPIEQVDNSLTINYTPYYLSAFTNAIQTYSKEDGKVETQTFQVADLNAGKVSKFDTSLLKTKANYVQDNFYKYMMATQSNLSDYESASESELSSQIITKYQILNEKKALNGDGFNKGLFRSATTSDYNTRTFSLPTSIGACITEIAAALAIANTSSNGRKRLLALGTFKGFLYSETSEGSGVLNIKLLQERFPNIDFINTDDIKGLPTANGYLMYDPALGHIKQTGNGAGLLKTLDTVTGKDYVFDNGSVGAYFTAENGAVYSTIGA